MSKSQDVEIRLVDRIDQPSEPAGDQDFEGWEMPRQGHQEGRTKIGNGPPEDQRGAKNRRQLPPSSQRTPDTENEDQLPREGIERPEPVRISRQVQIVPEREDIKAD